MSGSVSFGDEVEMRALLILGLCLLLVIEMDFEEGTLMMGTCVNLNLMLQRKGLFFL